MVAVIMYMSPPSNKKWEDGSVLLEISKVN